MILVYGNKYVENEEEWNEERPDDKDIMATTLDYLDSMQFIYENRRRPEDWYSSLFWRIEE